MGDRLVSQLWPKHLTSNMFKNFVNCKLESLVILKVHYTSQQMFKMGFAPSNTFSQWTGNILDKYIHAFCFCPHVQMFWGWICEDLSKCPKCNIPPSPSICLLAYLDKITLNALDVLAWLWLWSDVGLVVGFVGWEAGGWCGSSGLLLW